jgi:hypothetical protein
VLTIHSPDGDVAVRAVDRPDVLIGYGSASHWNLGDDAAGLTIDVRDNHIDIRPHPRLDVEWAGVAGHFDLDGVMEHITRAFRGGGSFFSAKPGKVGIGSGDRLWPDIVVELPRSIAGRLEIHSASGDTHVEGFTGEIALNTMSGDLRAVRSAGTFVLQTASGNLTVEDASGRFTALTASGDVRVTSAQIDEFQIQTANGDIQIDALLAGDGPFRAQTASGDVRLTLRRSAVEGEEPTATLSFQSVSGDASVAPPFRKIDRRRWQSGLGERGPHIGITTVNGDLTAAISTTESAFVPAPSPAVFSDDDPLAPPVPATPDWPHSESELARSEIRPEASPSTADDNAARLAVLEAVERGEIDIEEALRRLDAEDVIASS